METEGDKEESRTHNERTISKFDLKFGDKSLESAKENFLTFMEAVWPTVANYYLEVEKEILNSIEKGNPKKVKYFQDKENASNSNVASPKNSLCILQNSKQGKPNSHHISQEMSTSSIVSTYDCSIKPKKPSLAYSQSVKATKSRKKIVQTKDEEGNILWDVVEETIDCTPDSVHRIENSSAPIAVHHDPGLLYTESPDNIPPDIRQAIADAETQIRQALSACFGKTSKSFTNSYPKIRLMINKAYPQIRHTVSCSYPNIQYTINNSYDKVQGTVKSTYPKIRKTVTGSYPKRQSISSCYRKVRQLQNRSLNIKCDSLSQVSKHLTEANEDLTSRLAAANAEVSQSLHNTSKKISIALGTANLEILQALKNASNKVSKSLIKANSEILEALAMANDDLRKSLALICNEAARTLQTIKIQLSQVILDLHPNVWHLISKAYENLQQALDASHVEILQTLADVSSEVCEQISNAHGKYSEAKVTVNYELSLALAKANSQVLQILIAANSKISDVLDKNTDKVQQITNSGKLGLNAEMLESRVWRAIEKGETDVWRTSENASFTIESAVETTDSRLWKVADEADNNLRKTVQSVESKLVASIGSAEWKLKSCAERLETLVTECVGKLVDTAWQSVSCYISEVGASRFSAETTTFHNSANQQSCIETSLPNIKSSSSVKVVLQYSSQYYVGFPESEDDEDFDPSALSLTKCYQFGLQREMRKNQLGVKEAVSNNQLALKEMSGDAIGDAKKSAGDGNSLLYRCKESESEKITLGERQLEAHASIDTFELPERCAVKAATQVLDLSENSGRDVSLNSSDDGTTTDSVNMETTVTKAECYMNLTERRGNEDESSDNSSIELVMTQSAPVCCTQLLPVSNDNNASLEQEVPDSMTLPLVNELEEKAADKEKHSICSQFADAGAVVGKIGDHVSNAEIMQENYKDLPSAERFCASKQQTLEQLSESFQKNLEKIQLSLSLTERNKIVHGMDTVSTNFETQQLLKECTLAWNMIKSLCNNQMTVPKEDVLPESRKQFSKEADLNLQLHSDGDKGISATPEAHKKIPGAHWDEDAVFGKISWESVESSKENIEVEVGHRDSCADLILDKPHLGITKLEDLEKPKSAIAIVSARATTREDLRNEGCLEIQSKLNSTGTHVVPDFQEVFALGSEPPPVGMDMRNNAPEQRAIPVLVSSTGDSDFEDQSSTASPPPSVITLPFTDDEQQIDVYPQTSCDDGSATSDTPPPYSDNVQEMMANFLEISTALFYQASCDFQDRSSLITKSMDIRDELNQHQMLALMSAEGNLRNPMRTNNLSIPCAPSTIFHQTSVATETNMPPGKRKLVPRHYLKGKFHSYTHHFTGKLRRLCPNYKNRLNFRKFLSCRSLKNLVPCFQNSGSKTRVKVSHPIRRVPNCTNLLRLNFTKI